MRIVLQTSRLVLRSWSPADEGPFHAICSDPRVMEFVGDGTPWSRQRARAFLDEAIAAEQQLGFCRWAVALKESGLLIGFCGFVRVEDGAEIGWRLAAEAWGRGLATEAARAALSHGFDALGFQRVTAAVQSANAASLRIVEKLGMRFDESVFRGGREVRVYSIRDAKRP